MKKKKDRDAAKLINGQIKRDIRRYKNGTKVEIREHVHVESDIWKALGYVNERDYLLSGDWKKAQRKHLKKHKECGVCKQQAKRVLILRMDTRTLLGLDARYLASLCQGCYDDITLHRDNNGRHTNVRDCQMRFYARVKAFRTPPTWGDSAHG